MRKRRCFADKELESVMLERERRLVSDNHGPIAGSQDASSSVYQMAPREYLRSVFPVVNANVLELVYQGCGGSLERAVEQIAHTQRTAHAQQHAKLVGHVMQMAPQKEQAPSAFTTVVKPTCVTAPRQCSPMYGRQIHLLPTYGVSPPNTFAFSHSIDLLAQRSAFRTKHGEMAATSRGSRIGSHSPETSSAASPVASHCLLGQDSGSCSPSHSDDISMCASPPSAPKTRTNSLITFSVESIIGK